MPEKKVFVNNAESMSRIKEEINNPSSAQYY